MNVASECGEWVKNNWLYRRLVAALYDDESDAEGSNRTWSLALIVDICIAVYSIVHAHGSGVERRFLQWYRVGASQLVKFFLFAVGP